MDKKAILFIFAGVVLVIGTLMVFSSNNQTEIVNRDSTGQTVVAFGDSLVEGVGADDGSNFVDILSKRIGEPIVNEGISGDTTVDGLARVDEVIKHDPRIVIVLLGGNDAIKNISKEETFANLERIVKSLQDNGSAVILVGVQSGILRDVNKKEYNKLSSKLGTAYVPNILEDIIGSPDLMSDPIHPNEAGYLIMADRIEPVLQDLLQ